MPEAPLILVIDDEAPIRANVRRFLLLEGYRVAEAGDGIEGVEVALAERPDLILCDVMMPRLDGFGVLQRVRASSVLASVPFVFLTASAEKSDLERGLDLGAEEYVTKPFNLIDLGRLVARRLAGTAEAKGRK